jgi:monovalent cation:proton antiporter-2 (CPA2) family protein
MLTLPQTAILLAAAVVSVSIFRLARLSSILGYVAAGLVIGPWGLQLIGNVDSILHIAELGVVLLLFIIGLELQPARLRVMRRVVFGLGSAQVLLCTAVLGGAAWMLGLAPTSAAIVGFGLSLSSTPLVLQVLAERGQVSAPHGRAAFGMLLFQDLAVLPVLALLPLLTGAPEPAAQAAASAPWWLSLLKVLLTIAGVLIGGGRVLLRPLLRIVARINVAEVFTAAALLTVILTALIAQLAGLSMSLGAFLGGVLLADSEFRHELEADLSPFKGLLLGLFFVCVGMSANLGLALQAPGTLVALTAGFLALKLLAVTLVGRLAGYPGAASWRLGFALPAGGEFAFVLFALAVRQRLLDAHTADLLVLVVTLSMMAGPLLLILHDALAARFQQDEKAPFDDIDEHDIPVIIAGFGRFGQIVARLLRVRRIPFTALDSSQTHVDFVRRFGNKIYYGDASRLDLLRSAGAASARVFVLAIDDQEASLRTARVLREHFPHLTVFARARNRQHAFALMDLGITRIIRETYASSLEMAAGVLASLGQSEAATTDTVRRFREHDEATLAKQYEVKDDEEKLVATSRAAARQLEHLFEADEVEGPGSAGR